MNVGFPMDESSRQAIVSTKERIMEMLRERSSLISTKQTTLPSNYWAGFCSQFDYMMDLSADSLAKIRLHTYHISGETYLDYYFDVTRGPLRAAWETLVRETPPGFILSEPTGGFGLQLSDGPVINWDVYRAQFALNVILGQGVLPATGKEEIPRRVFLEIGAGYGSTAHQLSTALGRVSYVIVDLPETLLFSSTYLTLLNPGKNIYVYDAQGGEQALGMSDVAKYDFILIPNYRLEMLRDLKFDVVVNVASLQEMTVPQVKEYLDFIRETCCGFFYSYNQDAQPRNEELENLTNLLRERFIIEPISEPRRAIPLLKKITEGLRGALRALAIILRLVSRPERNFLNAVPYRPYVCRPRPVDKQRRVA